MPKAMILWETWFLAP